MRYLLLEDIKAQLVVEHEEDDDLLDRLGGVAERALEQHIKRPLEDILIEGQMPEDAYHAMLMHVAALYENRSEVSMSVATPRQLPMGYDFLVTPYKKYE